MALVLADRVRETTTVVGTGTATLLGAVAGYQSFTAVGNANTTYYVIASQSAGEWEVGIGTYTASGTTLSRDTVLSSSNAGSLVNFSAGTKDIWVDYAAGKAVTTDTLAYPPVIGSTTPNAATFTTLTATSTATLGGDATSPALVAASNAGNTRWLNVAGSVAGGVSLNIVGAGNGDLFLTPRGTGGVSLSTAASATNLQFRAAHTASAVNYVQVTGAATGGSPTISAQGSDSNVEMRYNGKGTSGHLFYNGNGYAQFRVLGSASALNYATVAGSVSGNAVPFSVAGSDTNIAAVFQSKGTGAIDLAAGSSGVNISNGGTVTAITRTAAGSVYTSIPTVVISAPTTAGGVQATATTTMTFHGSSPTINNGGTGYTAGDTLTVVGGTPVGSAGTLTVTSVSGGVITGVNHLGFNAYTVLPTVPYSVTGGTGSGATFTSTWQLGSFTITNAGSGYVEQPTVTFSGGGGSGAAAYASVGSGTTVRSLGTTLDFFGSGGRGARINTGFYSGALTDWITFIPSTFGGPTVLGDNGAGGNVGLRLSSSGTSPVDVFTNGTGQRQFSVAHTASAVNYVQVTGAVTAGPPAITAQGSDAAIALLYVAKGGQDHRFFSNSGNAEQFRVIHTAGTMVNQTTATGSATGVAPAFSVRGSDTNIDLALTPKGTGNVRFGTHTSLASTTFSIGGYIEIKDSSGTLRKLAVIA